MVLYRLVPILPAPKLPRHPASRCCAGRLYVLSKRFSSKDTELEHNFQTVKKMTQYLLDAGADPDLVMGDGLDLTPRYQGIALKKLISYT